MIECFQSVFYLFSGIKGIMIATIKPIRTRIAPIDIDTPAYDVLPASLATLRIS